MQVNPIDFHNPHDLLRGTVKNINKGMHRKNISVGRDLQQSSSPTEALCDQLCSLGEIHGDAKHQQIRISLGEQECWAFVMIWVGMTAAKSITGIKQEKKTLED